MKVKEFKSLFLVCFFILYNIANVSAASAVLDYCENLTGWNSSNSLSLDSVDLKEGYSSLKQEGTGVVQFSKSYTTSIDTGIEVNQWGVPGYLQFWFYVSDLSQFNGEGQIELSSSGTSDNNEFGWEINKYVTPYLENGWNLIRLKLDDATQTGTPDLSSINWFRIYQFVDSSIITKIDDIHIYDMSLDDCESSLGWNSTNILSLDTTDYISGSASLKSEGTGHVHFYKQFSYNSYSGGLDISEVEFNFWYYVSDVTKFNGEGQIELTSSGTNDNNEFSWDMNTFVTPYLSNGWNHIRLRLDEAAKIGNPDLNSINWFRSYQFVNGSVITKIDKLAFNRILPKPANSPTPRVATTTLSTKDIPIITFDVNEFGAVKNDGLDDTQAFQDALNAAGYYGGGVVFAPVGEYEIYSHMIIPENVTLRGDWQSPEQGGLGNGTILKAYENKNNPEGRPFIITKDGATLRDFTIWYPEQNDINNISAYPWTIANKDIYTDLYYDGYYGPNIYNLTLINSYNGIKIDRNNAHTITNLYGTILNHGMNIDGVYDIGRLESIKLAPQYWSNSGLGTPPSITSVRNFLRNNAVGISLYKSDWEYIYDIYIEGYNTALYCGVSEAGDFNGQINQLRTEDVQIGIQLDRISEIGVVISNSTINTSGTDSISVNASSAFSQLNSVSFNSSTIGAPDGIPVKLEGDGVLNFNHTTFTDWSASSYAIVANNGTIAATANTFNQDKPDIYLGASVSSATILANTFFNNTPDINNSSSGEIKIDTTSMTPANIPQMPTASPAISSFRKPSSNLFFNVKSYGAAGDGQTDDTAAFTAALNDAAAGSGGTVYIPSGRYKINTHLTVGNNVELRGSSDGPSHFGVYPKGTVLIATENEGNPGGAPFISLSENSGIRGLSIFYPNQNYSTISMYPPTILGNGIGSYVIDVTLPDSYTGIKMLFRNYYINYARGMGLDKFLILENITGPGYVMNIMNTVGDWQDSEREQNAPPKLWWQQYPSSMATGIEINNSSDVNLFNNFSFGIGYALKVLGSSSDITIIGHGIDNSEKSIQLTGSGSNIIFINTQLVAIGGLDKRYIYTSPTFSGETSFFNTLAWACDEGIELNGTGKVILQQLKNSAGSITQYGGTMWLDSSFLHDSSKKVILDANITDAAVFANIGSTLEFGIINNSNDPDVWMNIRK